MVVLWAVIMMFLWLSAQETHVSTMFLQHSVYHISSMLSSYTFCVRIHSACLICCKHVMTDWHVDLPFWFNLLSIPIIVSLGAMEGFTLQPESHGFKLWKQPLSMLHISNLSQTRQCRSLEHLVAFYTSLELGQTKRKITITKELNAGKPLWLFGHKHTRNPQWLFSWVFWNTIFFTMIYFYQVLLFFSFWVATN